MKQNMKSGKNYLIAVLDPLLKVISTVYDMWLQEADYSW